MLNLLRQHQSDFTGALIHPHDDNGFVQSLKRSAKISPQLALDIYRNNTRGARINALQLVYPVCNRILGNKIFRSIAREYVLADTAGLSDLNRYGERFNQQFQLLLNSGRVPADYSYLADLARLEFIIHAAYYADNDPEFDFRLFEQKVNDEEPVEIMVSASLGLLDSQYPVYEIWLSNKRQQPSENIDAIEGRQYLVIHRNDVVPKVIAVSRTEYRLLEAFVNNVSLQQAAEISGCDIEIMLPVLIANKWVTGVR